MERLDHNKIHSFDYMELYCAVQFLLDLKTHFRYLSENRKQTTECFDPKYFIQQVHNLYYRSGCIRLP